MNRLYLLILFIIFLPIEEVSAQEERTVKAISGVQGGLGPGAWVHREYAMSPKFVLRAEAGFNFSFWYSSSLGLNFLILPKFNLEPRLYYNFSNRVRKGKSTKDNAANFFSLRTLYIPYTFSIPRERLPFSAEGARFSSLAAIPSWGLRRNIGENANFETSFGVGVLTDFYRIYPSVGISLRFGFKFGRRTFEPQPVEID